MRIAVIGTGRVGLVTSVALAHIGHDVDGVDADAGKIDGLRAGSPPFFEPGLEELLSSAMSSGFLRFGTGVAQAVSAARVVFICVGRPPTAAGDRSLTAVEAVARDLAGGAGDGLVIAQKATVPPGTADRLRVTVARERPGLDFSVVSNPEFLREGHAIADTLEPARIVVGSDDERGFRVMREVYAPITANGHPLLEMDVRSAELAKLSSNAFLALKISFANSLARVAELSNADILRVAEVMGTDPRIGNAFLAPGLGYGGFCLPKDVVALEEFAERAGFEFSLLREVRRVNGEAAEHVAGKVEEAVWNLEGKRIALLGLAFKPGTDDVREAPALALAERFLREGAHVVGHDPMAAPAARARVPGLGIASDPYEAATGAHCIVLCTEWNEYRDLDLDRLRSVMAYAIIVDGRNFLDPHAAGAAGFSYFPVGRPSSVPESERAGR